MDERHSENTNMSFKKSAERTKKIDVLNNNLFKAGYGVKRLQTKSKVNFTDDQNIQTSPYLPEMGVNADTESLYVSRVNEIKIKDDNHIHRNGVEDHAREVIKQCKSYEEVQKYVQSEPPYAADPVLTEDIAVCAEAYIDKDKPKGSADIFQLSVSNNSRTGIDRSLQDKKKSFLAQWKYFIENIEPIPLKEELDRHQFLVTKNFIDFEKKQRSHQVSLLLITAYRNIQNDRDFFIFQKIISNVSVPCAEILDQPLKENRTHIGDTEDSVLDQYHDVLTRHRSDLEIKLRSSDFLDIVNDFVEDSIVDLDQLEKLISDFPNRETFAYFIDIVLDKLKKKSIHCLVKSLKKQHRIRRFQFFLTEIEKATDT